MPGYKEKTVWEGELACAHCQEPNKVKITKVALEPATPAETEMKVYVEKGTQAKLD